MALLYSEDIANSRQLLLDVFREGYSEGYVGDEGFLQGYLLPAQVAILDDRTEELNAAALIRNSRIMAVATRTDREKYGSRFQNLVGILQFAHLADCDAWMGIGVEKHTVKIAAQQAGMSRSSDEQLLQTRLERSGKIGSYALASDDTGLLISLDGSRHGPNYWQEVWDWHPK